MQQAAALVLSAGGVNIGAAGTKENIWPGYNRSDAPEIQNAFFSREHQRDGIPE
jgi:hypothetical protein